MKRIALSMMTIFAVSALVATATFAVFSDTATVEDNTFSTGVLEMRVNSQEAITGMTVTNAAPGAMGTKTFALMNYGAPWFAGPSTLNAYEIAPKAMKTSGDSGLYNKLHIRLYANAGWGGCSKPGVAFVAGKGCEVYNGKLKDLNGSIAQDVLHATQWGYTDDYNHAMLATGNSLTMTAEVELPVSAGNDVMGKTTMFDLMFTGYNPHR